MVFNFFKLSETSAAHALLTRQLRMAGKSLIFNSDIAVVLLFHNLDDQRHVAVLQYLDHALLVERDAAARVGLGTFHVDEDGAAIGIDALLVEVGGDAVVVLWLVRDSVLISK